MVIDKPEHKQFILEMFRQVSIPGAHLDLAYQVKEAVAAAQVAAPAPAPAPAPEDGSAKA